VLSNYFRDLDVGDRRVFTPDIDNKYQNDNVYFGNLAKLMTKPTLQYIFNFLYSRAIPETIKVPQCDVKDEYKESHMNSVVKFIVDKYLIENKMDDGETIDTKTAWTLYERKQKDSKYACKKDQFFHTFKQYVPIALNKAGNQKVIHGYVHYDVSYNTLVDRIIKRSKVISLTRLEQMQVEYKESQEIIDDVEVEDGNLVALKKEMKEKEELLSEIEKLKLENAKLKAENEKLKTDSGKTNTSDSEQIYDAKKKAKLWNDRKVVSEQYIMDEFEKWA
jgi:hypothetical protein